MQFPKPYQGECGKQGTAKLACKGVVVVEEKVSALQLPKPPAPNSPSADGVDNPPRDPVCHTSDLGHTVEKIEKGQLPKPYQGERGKQRPAKLACKGVVVVEEKVSALQLPKPPAPNPPSADGLDNPPSDPVCRTSDLGHAVEKIKKGQLLKPPAC